MGSSIRLRLDGVGELPASSVEVEPGPAGQRGPNDSAPTNLVVTRPVDENTPKLQPGRAVKSADITLDNGQGHCTRMHMEDVYVSGVSAPTAELARHIGGFWEAYFKKAKADLDPSRYAHVLLHWPPATSCRAR